jgi:alkylated DNA repair protein (DNA oxidative demethylase)
MVASRRLATEPPAGFQYVDDFVGPDEERRLIGLLDELPWEAVVFRGYEARRRVVHFGHRYDFEARGVSPGMAIPEALLSLRERAATLTGEDPERYVEVLATEYRPGATIGWHSDAPAFGSTVLGVSLASGCRMRFRRRTPDGWLRFDRVLEPRSAYVIGGAARTAWQHSIPPTETLRYSVTYRTVREQRPSRG